MNPDKNPKNKPPAAPGNAPIDKGPKPKPAPAKEAKIPA